jgi:thiamine pyrophosphate-dependent acetolactate synthase large subunit-like protein
MTVTDSSELDAALERAIAENAAGRSVVVDAVCDSQEKVFPMIPPGASAADILEYGSHEKVKEFEAR